MLKIILCLPGSISTKVEYPELKSNVTNSTIAVTTVVTQLNLVLDFVNCKPYCKFNVLKHTWSGKCMKKKYPCKELYHKIYTVLLVFPVNLAFSDGVGSDQCYNVFKLLDN